ncbi:hypothetical protein D3C78_1912530 [compost metagenome]
MRGDGVVEGLSDHRRGDQLMEALRAGTRRIGEREDARGVHEDEPPEEFGVVG